MKSGFASSRRRVFPESLPSRSDPSIGQIRAAKCIRNESRGLQELTRILQTGLASPIMSSLSLHNIPLRGCTRPIDWDGHRTDMSPKKPRNYKAISGFTEISDWPKVRPVQNPLAPRFLLNAALMDTISSCLALGAWPRLRFRWLGICFLCWNVNPSKTCQGRTRCGISTGVTTMALTWDVWVAVLMSQPKKSWWMDSETSKLNIGTR